MSEVAGFGSGSFRNNRNQIGIPRSANILHTACEAKSTECVKFLIDEIMAARKSLIHSEDEDVMDFVVDMDHEANTARARSMSSSDGAARSRGEDSQVKLLGL